MIRPSDLQILKAAVREGDLLPLEVKPFLEGERKETLGEYLVAQGLLTQDEWNRARKTAEAQSHWLNSKEEIHRENQQLWKILQGRQIFSPPKLSQLKIAFEKARKSYPSLRLGQFLLSQKILTPPQGAKALGLLLNSYWHCQRCRYHLPLNLSLSWRKYPCPFCSASLAPGSLPSDSQVKTRGGEGENIQKGKKAGKEERARALEEEPTRWEGGETRILKADGLEKTTFGKYEIVEKLGQGGMGAVYKARDTALERVVALKVINLSSAEDDQYIERFYREVKLAASLRHPGIVPVYDFGEEEGRHYYTLGYVEGQSLRDYVKEKGRLSEEEALDIVKEVAKAVEFAHSEDVIHRDIKPDNIMIDKEGKAQLMDFGLAKRIEGEDTKITRTGAIVGSPEFMAPEQALGDKEVGPGADIYALGGVLFYCLVGRPPFEGEDTMKLLMQTIEKPPPRLRKLQSGISREVEIMVEKCLEKEVQYRYMRATDLWRDIKSHLRGRPIEAKAPSSLQRGWRWVKRHRALVASVLVVFLSLTVTAVYIWDNLSLQEEKRRQKKEMIQSQLARTEELFLDGTKGELSTDRRREKVEEIYSTLEKGLTRTQLVEIAMKFKRSPYTERRLLAFLTLEKISAKGDISYRGKSLRTWMLEWIRDIGNDFEEDYEERSLVIKSLLPFKSEREIKILSAFLKSTVRRVLEQGDILFPESFLWRDLRKGFEGMSRAEFALLRDPLARGLSHFIRKEYKKAIEVLSEGIEKEGKKESSILMGILRGYCLLYHKNYDAFIDELEELDRLYPDDPFITLNLGRALTQRALSLNRSKDWKRAENYLEKGRKLNPDISKAALMLANYYFTRAKNHPHFVNYKKINKAIQRDCQKARKILKEVKKKFPRQVEAYLVEAQIQIFLQKPYKAEDILKEALENNLRTGRVFLTLAHAYRELGQEAKFKEYWEKARDLTSFEGETEREMVLFHLERNNYKKALEWTEAYQKQMVKDRSSSHFFKTVIYTNTGQWKKAKKFGQKCLQLSKKYYSHPLHIVLLFLGQTEDNLGHYPQAIRHYNRVIEIAPELWKGYYCRGNLYFRRKKWKKTIEDFTKVIEIFPEFAMAYKFRGLAYKHRGLHQKAARDLSKYARANPRDPENSRIKAYLRDLQKGQSLQDLSQLNDPQKLVQQGLILARRGKRKKALKYFDKAVKINPHYWQGLLNRGVLLYMEKRYALALKDFQKVCQLNPRLPHSYKFLAGSYEKLGNHQKALQFYEKYLKMNPRDPEAYKMRRYIKKHKRRK